VFGAWGWGFSVECLGIGAWGLGVRAPMVTPDTLDPGPETRNPKPETRDPET